MKPYELCATRIENRGDAPPTRKYVDELVASLERTGVEASWHSAVDALGYPLYPSKVVPNCHPEANFESFRYLIDSLHAIGRPVISWYALNSNRAVLDAHPDWEMRFYEIEGAVVNPKAPRSQCCFNSPYGRMLPEIAVEIVRDVGFDGLWFDGSIMGNMAARPVFAPGCTCGFCRDRFEQSTGLQLPEKVNYGDRTFRLWVNWRYETLMDVWRRIVDAVALAKPEAVVCFNNLRRRSGEVYAWPTAIPLRKLDFDMVMSSELDGFCGQADFQMKINRAYGCTRGVETWWPLCDNWNLGAPDVEPLPAVQAALGAIAAGGVSCAGVAVSPALQEDALRAMQQAASSAVQYVGGETVEYAAILASQQTQDFFGKANPMAIYDEWHGANEVCRQGHVQSSIIFDDHISGGELSCYPLIVLGNAVCVSQQQADQLREYVRAGGTLFACHQAGELDELGFLHERPILDTLLGIGSRRMGAGNPTLDICDKETARVSGRWVTLKGVPVIAEPVDDVEMLADMIDCTYDMILPEPRYPGMWLRQVGRGAVIYCGANLFRSYLHAPTPHMLRMLTAVMRKLAIPQIELAGPLCVTMNCRRQLDGRWAVHLHNAPGSAYRYPAPQNSNYLHSPGEVLPVFGLKLQLNGQKVRTAVSGITGNSFDITGDGTVVQVPTLALHDVILLEVG